MTKQQALQQASKEILGSGMEIMTFSLKGALNMFTRDDMAKVVERAMDIYVESKIKQFTHEAFMNYLNRMDNHENCSIERVLLSTNIQFD